MPTFDIASSAIPDRVTNTPDCALPLLIRLATYVVRTTEFCMIHRSTIYLANQAEYGLKHSANAAADHRDEAEALYKLNDEEGAGVRHD